MVVHTCHPSTQEARQEDGKLSVSLGLRHEVLGFFVCLFLLVVFKNKQTNLRARYWRDGLPWSHKILAWWSAWVIPGLGDRNRWILGCSGHLSVFSCGCDLSPPSGSYCCDFFTISVLGFFVYLFVWKGCLFVIEYLCVALGVLELAL